jgi:tRNA(Ile)-lysidine synthase
MAPLTESVRDMLQRHKMICGGDRVAVAVSGGADSVSLLRLLEELRYDLGVTLCVIHFNHLLRADDSDEDEGFVASLAHDHRLAFFSERTDVAAVANQQKRNLEDTARRLRYDFFAKIVGDGVATCVATAHTADDQAETVLARLIRGTGLTGLGSIYPVRGHVIRPLLEVRRTVLRTYLESIKQEWREDATNADTRRLRARVRQRLLPELEQNFSSSIVRKLGDFADLARDDQRFWASLVEERCAGFVARTAETASINVADLLWPLGNMHAGKPEAQIPFRAVTQRIVRHLYAIVAASGGELSRGHVEQVIQLTEKGLSGRQLELPGRVRVRRQFDQLVFVGPPTSRRAREHSQRQVSYAHQVDIPAHGSADVSVPEIGRRFHLKVIDWPTQERETTHEGVVLDAERLCPPLILRNWTPGDAYCPSGRQRPRKLARMLMARRVSAAQRVLWPVLTSAGRVVWADSMPVAKEFSASEATRRGVWIVEDRW